MTFMYGMFFTAVGYGLGLTVLILADKFKER